MKIVIVGGGITAVYLANNLLLKDSSLEILILSNEKFPPYDRIHLCALVDNSLGLDEITLELSPNAKLFLNEEVTNIDPKEKVVTTKDNSYPYDKLIIATGSKPKVTFDISNIKNATTFRSATDAYKIRDNIPHKNVVLVGVGPISLELLDTLSKIENLENIYLIGRKEHLYCKDLDIGAVKLIDTIFTQNKKIKISYNDEITDTQIENNEIKKIITKNHTIENPFLIFGVGIEPNIEFAKSSLSCHRGILVDDCMRTSDENIYAVGEACELSSSKFIAGRVKECTNECDVAIASIVGEEKEFLGEVAIDALKVGSFLLADITSKTYDGNDINNENIIISSKKENRFDQYIINQNKLVKFIGINTNIDILHLKSLMEEEKSIDAGYFFDNRLVSERGRLVCSCSPTHELDLVEIIEENCVREFCELKEFSEAGRVCGRCKQDISKIIQSTPTDPIIAQQKKEAKAQAKLEKEHQLVEKRIDKYNQLHATNQIDTTNLDAAMESFDLKNEYNKWISMMTASLRLHPQYESTIQKAVKNLNKIPIIWLELSDCTGNSESFIKSSHPTVEDLILDFVSLDYHELLMAAAGDESETVLEETIKKHKGKFVLLVEGAVPLGLDGKFLRIGPKGETGLALLQKCAKEAAIVISVGSCAYDGGIVAAGTNPTGAVGVAEALQRDDIINLPGCPTNPINIVGTLLHYIMFEELPALDTKNRPLWAYSHKIHDNCERRGHYDADEFVQEWGDDGAKQGWCLFKMGCKGPYANLNCSLVKFNEGSSWPVQVGHGCFGCGEGKIAFDKYANNRELPAEEQK
ncbi:MAG: hydrogenase small subunit [Arcobacteraceae bacterium]|nr:hydrogenase small subunit [Arcobacteraceae bacterium]